MSPRPAVLGWEEEKTSAKVATKIHTSHAGAARSGVVEPSVSAKVVSSAVSEKNGRCFALSVLLRNLSLIYDTQLLKKYQLDPFLRPPPAPRGTLLAPQTAANMARRSGQANDKFLRLWNSVTLGG
ncbi:hypothetical protein AGIG_G24435 [Arapaima gigas]